MKTKSFRLIAVLLLVCAAFGASLAGCGKTTPVPDPNEGKIKVSFNLGYNASLADIWVTPGETYGSGLPAPSREGYTFGGWYFNKDFDGSEVTSSTTVTRETAHTLYAKWNGITVALTFDLHGGSINGDTETEGVNVTVGALYGIAIPDSPELAGHKFEGWYYDADGTQGPVAQSTVVTKITAHTLHAVYSETLTDRFEFTFADPTDIDYFTAVDGGRSNSKETCEFRVNDEKLEITLGKSFGTPDGWLTITLNQNLLEGSIIEFDVSTNVQTGWLNGEHSWGFCMWAVANTNDWSAREKATGGQNYSFTKSGNHGLTSFIIGGTNSPLTVGAGGSQGAMWCFNFIEALEKENYPDLVIYLDNIKITQPDVEAINNDISAAKSAIEGASYTMAQNAADTNNNAVDAKAYVKSRINTIVSAFGVKTEVIDGEFIPAIAGASGNINGTNGSYEFTVVVSKGIGAPQTTEARILTITAFPLDVTADNNAITQAKALIEGYAFKTQLVFFTAADAKKQAESMIAGISGFTALDVTFEVVQSGFTASAVGSVAGSYSFTVNIDKGNGARQTSVLKTLTLGDLLAGSKVFNFANSGDRSAVTTVQSGVIAQDTAHGGGKSWLKITGSPWTEKLIIAGTFASGGKLQFTIDFDTAGEPVSIWTMRTVSWDNNQQLVSSVEWTGPRTFIVNIPANSSEWWIWVNTPEDNPVPWTMYLTDVVILAPLSLDNQSVWTFENADELEHFYSKHPSSGNVIALTHDPSYSGGAMKAVFSDWVNQIGFLKNIESGSAVSFDISLVSLSGTPIVFTGSDKLAVTLCKASNEGVVATTEGWLSPSGKLTFRAPETGLYFIQITFWNGYGQSGGPGSRVSDIVLYVTGVSVISPSSLNGKNAWTFESADEVSHFISYHGNVALSYDSVYSGGAMKAEFSDWVNRIYLPKNITSGSVVSYDISLVSLSGTPIAFIGGDRIQVSVNKVSDEGEVVSTWDWPSASGTLTFTAPETGTYFIQIVFNGNYNPSRLSDIVLYVTGIQIN